MINSDLLKGSNSIIIEALEGYSDNNIMTILKENCINYSRITKASIIGDMREFSLTESGGTEEEIKSIQESNVDGFWGGLKEFFIKLGKKIKGMFVKIITKLQSFFMSKKDFVKKHKGKFIEHNLKDMKFKWRKPNQWNINIDTLINVNGAMAFLENVYSENNNGTITGSIKSGVKNDTDEEIKKEQYKSLLQTKFNKIDPDDDFKKEVFDILFDSKENGDEISSDIKSNILKVLENNKLIKNLEEDKNRTEKTIQNIIKAIDKSRDNELKKNPSDKKEIDARNESVKGYTYSSKCSHTIANLYSLSAGTVITANKFLVSQCYSIFVKGVNFTKHESTLLDAIEECAFDEVNEDLNESYAY